MIHQLCINIRIMKYISTLVLTIATVLLFSCHHNDKNVLYREGDKTVQKKHATDTIVTPDPSRPGKTLTHKVTLSEKIENAMVGSWRLDDLDHDIQFKERRAREKFEYTVKDIKSSMVVNFYKDNTYVLKSNRDNDKGNWKITGNGETVVINSHNKEKVVNYKVLEVSTDRMKVEMDKDQIHFILTLVKI